MYTNYLKFASWSMAIAIVIGALGAHALKSILTLNELASLQTAVRYEIYHALAILLISQLDIVKNIKPILISFVLGSFFFSGSIYLLIFLNHMEMSDIKSFVGPFTPIGGVLFIVGWILLALNIGSKKSI